MHIGFVGPVPPIRSGIAQHGGRVVDALRAAGQHVEVETWAAQYPRLLVRRQQADDAPSITGARRQLRWWSPLSWIRAGRRLRGCELVVFAWVTPFHAVPLRVVLACAGRPSVAVVHNVRPHERTPFAAPLTAWALRPASGAVVHATSVADDLASLLPGIAVTVVPHPPNLDVVPAPMPPSPPLRLLSLGTVRPYKGVDLAIRAVAEVRRRGIDAELTIAGEDWEGGETLRALARDLGVAEAVDFDLRWIPADEVSGLLARHHALLASYHAASQSGVVPLAHAAGRPVVVTPVGGLVEAVTDGVDGIVAGDASSEGIADAVERLDRRLGPLAAGAIESRSCWSAVAAAVTT